jgi:peptidoglycan/LPS O-acetylase OafA/YrhL
MNRLSETLVRGNNNFDLIRLMAALAVMFGHSYGVQGAKEMELMLRFSHIESSGSVAVYAFFMISGMLVSASFVNQASVKRFIALRMLRIWPGAMACAAFIALVVGPVFSVLPSTTYFTDTGLYRWLFHNALLIDPVGGALPRVFEGNHLKSLVNATVWTLPVELKCYMIVLVAGLLGCMGSRRRTVIVVALVGLVFAIFANHPPKYFSLGAFFVLPLAYSFYPVPFFLLGMLLYAFRDHVRLDWRLAVALSGIYLIVRYSWFGYVLFYPTLVYGLLCLGAAPMLRRFAPKHDYSYGIYLYGFVVQQAVAYFYPAMSSGLSLMFAVPVTVVLAAASWHLVERPCLASFRRRGVSAGKAGVRTIEVPGP